MGQAKDMAKVRSHRCNLLFRDTPMGRGDRGKLGQVSSRLGAAIVESTALCHGTAIVVCAAMALAVLIGWDRSVPFDFLAPYATPSSVRAGDVATITFRLGAVRRLCPGQFSRWFIDSRGKRFSLGTHPTVYDKYVSPNSDAPSYDKDIRVPRSAEPGPGIYETLAEYWCNPAQWLYPIKSIPIHVPITVLAP